jgi:hypothetical protein
MGRNNIGESEREGGKTFYNKEYDHLRFCKKKLPQPTSENEV